MCNFHACNWKNVIIKDLNAFRILMNFLWVFLGEKGGCTKACTVKPALNGPPLYKGHLPKTASILLSLRFSLYNEPLYNGPCLTRSAATINVPLHIGFPVYNGQSCMPIIHMYTNHFWILSGLVATVDNYFLLITRQISNFKATVPKASAYVVITIPCKNVLNAFQTKCFL